MAVRSAFSGTGSSRSRYGECLKSQKLIGKQMTAAFTRGADDARVWTPDQILGALGDQHHARVKNFKDFLGQCDTHIIALDC